MNVLHLFEPRVRANLDALTGSCAALSVSAAASADLNKRRVGALPKSVMMSGLQSMGLARARGASS